MNTDTPETDGEWNRLACQDHSEFERNLADFARKLERERDEVLEQVQQLNHQLTRSQEAATIWYRRCFSEDAEWNLGELTKLTEERDELRDMLQEEQRLHIQTLNERDEAREQVQQLNHQLARSQEDDDLLMIAWMHGAESNRRQCRDLARECDRLRDALRAIIGCGLNCKDSLDEAEQMERIAKEALSPENANSPPRGEKEA